MQSLFNLADRRALDVVRECTSRGIACVPYCSLGWPHGDRNRILRNSRVVALAARHRASPAQVALAWLLNLSPNILLIPGTRTRT